MTAGSTSPTGNVEGLGLLRQMVGTTPSTGDVELVFMISEPWRPDVAVDAAIVDDTFRPLAVGRRLAWRHCQGVITSTAARLPGTSASLLSQVINTALSASASTM
jgi:hypothetical protein